MDCSKACTDAVAAGINSDDCSASCTSMGKCKVDIKVHITTGDTIQGRFWPMTGCNFNSSNECASGRCCDTGGCKSSSGFGLQCTSSGDSPTTVAEFTLQTGQNNDFYDVSLIDGFNVPVEMKTECDGSVSTKRL